MSSHNALVAGGNNHSPAADVESTARSPAAGTSTVTAEVSVVTAGKVAQPTTLSTAARSLPETTLDTAIPAPVKVQEPSISTSTGTVGTSTAPKQQASRNRRIVSSTLPSPAPSLLGAMYLGDSRTQTVLHNASTLNIQAFYYGLATDPLSYFNAHTIGGRIISSIYRNGFNAAGTSFLKDIYKVTNATKSLCAVAALRESVHAAQTLLEQRRDFFRRLQKYCQDYHMDPPDSSPLWKSQIEAHQTAKMLCTYGITLSNIASDILQENIIIVQMPAKIQDPVKELTPELVKDIAQAVGMKFTSWPSTKIAGCFGLTKKDQVLALKADVARAILVELAGNSYIRNPAFIENIRNLKSKGCVHPNLSECRLLHGRRSVSSLRWLVIMYLGIPFKVDSDTPPFEPVEKDENLPLAWQTEALTKFQQALASGKFPIFGSTSDGSKSATLTRAVSEAPQEMQQMQMQQQVETEIQSQIRKNKRMDTHEGNHPPKKKRNISNDGKKETDDGTTDLPVSTVKQPVDAPAMLHDQQQSDIFIDPLLDLPPKFSLFDYVDM
ncbi:hypothetical protein IV203_001397 [Nitzschia inconspicua]|uniref:Uncharacterized protein n=1 Tax=Nitzschia inconspicua TaxID=303405 RepID=A0A9K3PRH4_9STRA|nr:hypothetical protein IV203_001397 [Nitzschia inconspicua]